MSILGVVSCVSSGWEWPLAEMDGILWSRLRVIDLWASQGGRGGKVCSVVLRSSLWRPWASNLVGAIGSGLQCAHSLELHEGREHESRELPLTPLPRSTRELGNRRMRVYVREGGGSADPGKGHYEPRGLTTPAVGRCRPRRGRARHARRHGRMPQVNHGAPHSSTGAATDVMGADGVRDSENGRRISDPWPGPHQ